MCGGARPEKQGASSEFVDTATPGFIGRTERIGGESGARRTCLGDRNQPREFEGDAMLSLVARAHRQCLGDDVRAMQSKRE